MVGLGGAAVGFAVVGLAGLLWSPVAAPPIHRVGRSTRPWPEALPPLGVGCQRWAVPPEHRPALLRLLAERLVFEGPVLLVGDLELEGPQLYRGDPAEACSLPGRPMVLADREVEGLQTPAVLLVDHGLPFVASAQGLTLDGQLIFRIEGGQASFA